MTVRITKPEFNLREELSELDRPVGLHGNEILRSETPQSTFDLVGTGRKNMVINGGMVISQRYGTSEHTPSHTQHVLDRMSFDVHVSSKLKAQQVTDAPTGFSHSMKVTSLSAHSTVSNNYFLMQYFVEGNDSARLKWGTSEAQPVTLSFYVKSSLAGTHACGIRNSDYNRSITKTYTIDQTDTWEYKTVTFPGDRTGTWKTDENAGLKINFDLGSGSDFDAASTGTWLATNDFITSNSVKVVGTNAATWYITGIQLEVGDTATSFEHRSYADELARCQRYYEDTFVMTDAGNNYVRVPVLYKVEKRAAGNPVSYAKRPDGVGTGAANKAYQANGERSATCNYSWTGGTMLYVSGYSQDYDCFGNIRVEADL